MQLSNFIFPILLVLQQVIFLSNSGHCVSIILQIWDINEKLAKNNNRMA